MSIRKPLTTVASITDTATSGTASYPFICPQDVDALVFKVTCTSLTGTNPTVDIYIQTTDDGGTTWYDCGNIGQVTAAIVSQNARWSTVQVDTGQQRGVSNFIGSVAASTTAAAMMTGMPILDRNCRVYLKYGGTQLANGGVNVVVYANTQSARP